MISLYIILCIASAVVTLVSFFLYVRARMANRIAQERRYLSIHYISLFLFVLFGVLILIHLSDSISRGASYTRGRPPTSGSGVLYVDQASFT